MTEGDMDKEGLPFLRRPTKGATRVWGMSSCQDCAFEARGEISVFEEDGTMRRRCGCCGQAAYPGLVEDHDAVWLAWLPEIGQGAAGHLARTAHMILHLTEGGARGSAGLERARNGAGKVLAFLAGRHARACAMTGLAPHATGTEILRAVQFAPGEAARPGFRLLPATVPVARLDAWAESGTFHGLTVADIDRMGTNYAAR